MANDIHTIFFDWGGVIANDPGDDFLMQLLRDIGATETQVQKIFETYMQRFMRGHLSESAYWNQLRNEYGLAIHDSISDEFKKWQGLVTNESILALADKAKAQGLQVALLTNVIEPTYNILLRSGCYDRFNEVIASCKVGFAKPEREIYRIALQQLQTAAEQSVFIDDKQANLDPADELGFKTILALSPEQIIRDVGQYL